MQEFFTQLVTALTECGFKDVRYWGSGDTSIRIGQFWFYARYRRRLLIFDGIEFRKVGGRYDIGKAVAHIIEQLPKRLEQAKAQAERQKRTSEAKAVDKLVDMSCFNIYSTSFNTFAVEFTHKDLTTIRAAVDYLQDGGFASDSAPRKKTDNLGMSTMVQAMKEIYNEMSDEEKKEFKEWYGGYSAEVV